MFLATLLFSALGQIVIRFERQPVSYSSFLESSESTTNQQSSLKSTVQVINIQSPVTESVSIGTPSQPFTLWLNTEESVKTI
jgi:hypothetical protein